MQSDYDASLNDLYSKETDIDLLKRQHETAACREEELQQALLSAAQEKVQPGRQQNELVQVKPRNLEGR